MYKDASEETCNTSQHASLAAAQPGTVFKAAHSFATRPGTVKAVLSVESTQRLLHGFHGNLCGTGPKDPGSLPSARHSQGIPLDCLGWTDHGPAHGLGQPCDAGPVDPGT